MNGEEPVPAAADRFRSSIALVLGEETVRAGLEPSPSTEAPEARARDRINHLEACRQANIENVIRLAAGELPEPGEESLVDHTWLTRFFDYARDVGEEEEQQVWANILRREFAAAGSFGKRTLAFLDAMEPWELSGFVEYAAFAFSFESGWRFMFDEESARREIWTYGRELDLTSHFIEIGLLAEHASHFNPDSASGLRICYGSKSYELGRADPVASKARAVAYRKFTVVGQQLSTAIQPKTFFGYARNVVKALAAECGARFELLEPATPSSA